MAARGLAVSATGVAAAYAPWLRALLVDERDQALAGVLEARGVRAVVDRRCSCPSRDAEVALARRVLETV